MTPHDLKHRREDFTQGTGKRGISEKSAFAKGYMLDLDRRHAIWNAMEMGDEKDLVLIAGKGHEDYQVVGKEKRHFDDCEVVKEFSFGEA